MTGKQSERFYLDLARALYSPFPPGDVVESESPDFVVRTLAGPLGIEVTKLFQPCSTSSFSPRQVESFREDVIGLAEEIYSESDNPAVDVTVYFSSPPTKQHKEGLARSLAEFVRANFPRNGTVLTFRKNDLMSASISSSVEVVRIAPPIPGRFCPWFGGIEGQTIPLTYDLLAAVISAKNPLVANYRDRVTKIWLLIVADLFPSSANFSVPAEVDTWCFDFNFDNVLLFSREESRVWELHRNHSGAASESQPIDSMERHA
ncbi:MAG: hypothetical protein HY207_06190 [Nitrospirae bacterium]|nr:hypothetical protein [Nitrospirota bacterium]